MPTATEPESGQLEDGDLEKALENVSKLFGDDDAAAGSSKDTDVKARTGSRGRSGSHSSVTYISARSRVDSTARPLQFMQNADKKGAALGTRSKQEFESFSAHGINQGALRHRIQSKAIDDSTIKRVLTDFGPHDKLSDKQLASLDELVTKAHKLHVHRDDQGAERIYRQVLEADPVNYDCLSNLAKIAYSRGELQQAHDLFERAIVVRPQHDKTVYHLAVVLYDMKHQERCKSLFEEVVQGYKGENKDVEEGERCDAKTYRNAIAMLGLIHQNLGDVEKARILYSTVLKEDEEHILTLDHKCSLLAVLGEHEEASKLHKHVCMLDPSHSKKTCPYLDSLFPRTSTLFHEQSPIENRLIKFERQFSYGARKKSWTNHPWKSLKKKVLRTLGKGSAKEHATATPRRV